MKSLSIQYISCGFPLHFKSTIYAKHQVIMKNWTFHDINFEGQTKTIEGLDIWTHDWKTVYKSFYAPHPQHVGQMHLMRTYYIELNGKKIDFSACEVSNMAWVIYISK
ncbi:MAG: hypothetical protein ACI82S_000461 [Patiriisocius sp.]